MSPAGVLFVVSDLRGGGAERATVLLANALTAAGWPVTLYQFHAAGVFSDEISPQVRLRAHLVDGRPVGLRALSLLAALVGECRRHRIVIGSLEGWPATMAWLAARIARRPVVAWVHTDLSRHFCDLSAALRWLFHTTFSRVDRVVCVSAGVRGELARLLGGHPQHLAVIGNIVAPAKAGAAQTFTDAGAVPLVLAAGRLQNDQKGFDLLIRAHAILRRNGLHHRLIILGEGPDRTALEALAVAEGVADSVSLPGFIRDMDSWYDRATVFVLPSRQEGLPMVLLEAMLRGVPVVAADCRYGPAELLDGGWAGDLVPADRPDALAAGLARLLADPAHRVALAARGRERASDYSAERILPQWTELLNALAPQ